MNLGVGEIFLIVLLVLVVFGPQRLPEITRNLGKAWRTFQTESQKAKSLLKEGLEQDGKSSRSAGVIDRADGTSVRRASGATPRRDPTAGEIKRAANVEPAGERKFEDT